MTFNDIGSTFQTFWHFDLEMRLWPWMISNTRPKICTAQFYSVTLHVTKFHYHSPYSLEVIAVTLKMTFNDLGSTFLTFLVFDLKMTFWPWMTLTTHPKRCAARFFFSEALHVTKFRYRNHYSSGDTYLALTWHFDLEWPWPNAPKVAQHGFIQWPFMSPSDLEMISDDLGLTFWTFLVIWPLNDTLTLNDLDQQVIAVTLK